MMRSYASEIRLIRSLNGVRETHPIRGHAVRAGFGRISQQVGSVPCADGVDKRDQAFSRAMRPTRDRSGKVFTCSRRAWRQEIRPDMRKMKIELDAMVGR